MVHLYKLCIVTVRGTFPSSVTRRRLQWTLPPRCQVAMLLPTYLTSYQLHVGTGTLLVNIVKTCHNHHGDLDYSLDHGPDGGREEFQVTCKRRNSHPTTSLPPGVSTVLLLDALPRPPLTSAPIASWRPHASSTFSCCNNH